LTRTHLIAVAVASLTTLGSVCAQPSNANRSASATPGEKCPAGMTEVRPGNCQAPSATPPSILDYRPRSTLIAPAHITRTAKFPAIDFHGHPYEQLNSAAGLIALGAALDSINVRVIVVANNASGSELAKQTELVRASPTMRDRVRILAGINFGGVGPGWAQKAVAQLEADVSAGAVGIGEIGKGLGLSTKKADGTRLQIDDPALDPVWQAAARLKLPVFIHTADPQEFWQPVDFSNERWLELALFPGRRYPADQYPAFETLMKERDNMLRRNPRTTFVIAHLGWHANDLGRLGAMMDALPNLHSEVGAVLYDIGRQPRAAHDFFVKYQDRILFGKDSFQPAEYPYYWRVFETRDDYFDYYRDYHAKWKLYGIELPDSVLKKVYFGNALRITGGLPQTGWPR
jgi:uncharacterized protein